LDENVAGLFVLAAADDRDLLKLLIDVAHVIEGVLYVIAHDGCDELEARGDIDVGYFGCVDFEEVGLLGFDVGHGGDHALPEAEEVVKRVLREAPELRK